MDGVGYLPTPSIGHKGLMLYEVYVSNNSCFPGGSTLTALVSILINVSPASDNHHLH